MFTRSQAHSPSLTLWGAPGRPPLSRPQSRLRSSRLRSALPWSTCIIAQGRLRRSKRSPRSCSLAAVGASQPTLIRTHWSIGMGATKVPQLPPSSLSTPARRRSPFSRLMQLSLARRTPSQSRPPSTKCHQRSLMRRLSRRFTLSRQPSRRIPSTSSARIRWFTRWPLSRWLQPVMDPLATWSTHCAALARVPVPPCC